MSGIALVALAALVFVLSFVLTAAWRRYALNRHMLDNPNARSAHVVPSPSGGGIGIVVASTVAGAWLVFFHVPGSFTDGEGARILVAVGLAVPLAGVGLLDDARGVSAKTRFVVQAVLVGLLLAVFSKLSSSGGGAFRVDDLMLAGLMLFSGLWWVNLFNFMDGIDGIAGVQAVSMLLMGALMASWGRAEVMQSPIWLFMLCVAAATFGFLLLNWSPAKIFMGDVGSTWLAFMIFALALSSIQGRWLSYASWLILAALFVTDASVTLLRRLLRGEKAWQAHRSHAYQRLSRRWPAEREVGHRAVSLLVLAVNVFWLAPLAWACLCWPESVVMWMALAYGPLLVGVLAMGAGRTESAEGG